MEKNAHPRVLVIGGGMAGVSAVEHLLSNGITDVIILEAADRCGGRIQTVHFGDSDQIVELGANWIHGGSPGNCIFTLASRHGLVGPKVTRLDRTQSQYFMSSGVGVDEQITQRLNQAFQDLDKETQWLERRPGGDSMKAFLMKRRDEVAREFPAGQRSMILAAFNAHSNYMALHNGDNLDWMSAWGYGKYVNIPGGDVMVPPGYSSIVQTILNRIPEENIKLHHCVTKILWCNKSGQVQVTCANGAQFTADHVIVTVSLGVFKKHAATLFSPALPRDKMAAIDRTGFGRAGKIFLEYEKPFWVQGEWRSVRFAWTDEELEAMKFSPDGWITGVFGFEEVLNNPRLLVGWVSGSQAVEMETLTDTEIISTCARFMRKFLHDPAIPAACRILRSSWCSNPYILGAYSYPSTISLEYDQEVLAQPLPSCRNPKLLFAGEATHHMYHSTVHGARLSGLREANRILAHYIGSKL